MQVMKILHRIFTSLSHTPQPAGPDDFILHTLALQRLTSTMRSLFPRFVVYFYYKKGTKTVYFVHLFPNLSESLSIALKSIP